MAPSKRLKSLSVPEELRGESLPSYQDSRQLSVLDEDEEPEDVKKLAAGAGITWNMGFFGKDANTRVSRGSFSESEDDEVPEMVPGFRNRLASVANIARRGSRAAAQVVEKLDVLQSKGNPLNLGINEARRVSSVGYAPPGAFNGRRFSRAASLADAARKRSVAPAYVRPGLNEKTEDYVVKRLAAHDDIEHMSGSKRLLYRLTPLVSVLSITAYWIYFGLRVRFTRDAEVQAHRHYWMAWTFILVEIFVAMPMLLHRLWAMHIVGVRNRPKLRLMGDSVPSVDIIITCCGEDDNLILNTAKAACNIDYPLERFRVIICDDGRSTGLAEATERVAMTQFDNLYYRSRPKYPGVDHHFKAGNLNYALEETMALPGGAANFLAALDADMIPEPDWLRALLPHMIQDSKCSMACPPQLFYNVPTDDPLCQSLDTFVHISEPIKDAMGVAWCTGSGYILRREALVEIGGFPTGSLAEDVCCSSMLLGAGWSTAFVHEPLQFGTVPDSLTSHLKQRTRWTIGTIQTSLKLRFCLYGPLIKHMTFAQRLCGFVYTASCFFTMFLVLSMFTIPIVLFSGGTLVPYASVSQLCWLIRTSFLSAMLNRINEFVAYIPSGYSTGQRDLTAMMWMAPFHAVSVIRTFILPKWLGGKIAVFTSSGSHKADLHERDPLLRASVWRRLKVTLWDCGCYPHLLYILFTLMAVAYSTLKILADGRYSSARDLCVSLLTHAAWPPLVWLACMVSCWVPLNYALFPPSSPTEKLLRKDPNSGVSYPTEEAKKTKTSWRTWVFEVQYSLLTAYTGVVFVMSFWLQ